eukprot:bmy_22591T0
MKKTQQMERKAIAPFEDNREVTNPGEVDLVSCDQKEGKMAYWDMFSSASTSCKLFPIGLKEEIEKPIVILSQGIATKGTIKSNAL